MGILNAMTLAVVAVVAHAAATTAAPATVTQSAVVVVVAHATAKSVVVLEIARGGEAVAAACPALVEEVVAVGTARLVMDGSAPVEDGVTSAQLLHAWQYSVCDC